MIVPVLNGEKYLKQGLDSIPRDLDVQLIVVDDGSSDASVEIALKAGAQVLRAEGPARGPAAARNRGLKAVTAPLIAFLDADDWWPEGSLQERLQVLRENPEIQVVQGLIETRENGDLSEHVAKRRLPDPTYNVNLGACLFRREVLEQAGPFDESLRFGEDTDFFMKLWETEVRKRFLLTTCLYYRLHQTNMTAEGPQDMLTNLKLLKRHKDRVKDTMSEKKIPWDRFVGWTPPTLPANKHYTQDYVSVRVPLWKQWFVQFRDASDLAILELGSYEGKSAEWFLENLCTHPSARLTCVDFFADVRIEARFDHNLSEALLSGRVLKVKEPTHRWLAAQEARPAYDLIYVDASHRAGDVLLDAMLSWRLLRPGGCMLLDDYLWQFGKDPLERPQLAIDLLLEAKLEGMELVYRGYQVLVTKTSGG